MRELTLEEMDCVSGGRGIASQFDSCNDPDGSEIYAVWASQDAYQHQWEAAHQSGVMKVSVYNLAVNDTYLSAARDQNKTCQVDSLFSNMIGSKAFSSIQSELIQASRQSGWEYAVNYYGEGHFGEVWTTRSPGEVKLSELSLWNLGTSINLAF